MNFHLLCFQILQRTRTFKPNCCLKVYNIHLELASPISGKDGDRKFLPPATKFRQGYIFTGVFDSVHRGGGVSGPEGVSPNFGGSPIFWGGGGGLQFLGGCLQVFLGGNHVSNYFGGGGVCLQFFGGSLIFQGGLQNFFFFNFFPTNSSGMHPPRDGQCAGGTHPTGMHSCYWPKRSFGQGDIFIGVCHEFCSQGGCSRYCSNLGGCVCSRFCSKYFGGVFFRGVFFWGVFFGGVFFGGIFFGGGIFWGGYFFGGVFFREGGVFLGGIFLGGYSLEYGQRSAGTHPTGMHSCLFKAFQNSCSVPNSYGHYITS